MDLSVQIDGIKLKIRVAGIVSTPKGFLFEKSDKNYIFPIGGKIKINETSCEALIREIQEEIGLRIDNPVLVSIFENFYDSGTEKVHEICFVYKVETMFKGTLPDNFIEVVREDLEKFKILPKPIAEILKYDGEWFRHIIIK